MKFAFVSVLESTLNSFSPPPFLVIFPSNCKCEGWSCLECVVDCFFIQKYDLMTYNVVLHYYGCLQVCVLRLKKDFYYSEKNQFNGGKEQENNFKAII